MAHHANTKQQRTKKAAKLRSRLLCRQRKEFRAANGALTIWGKAPRMVEAKYKAGGELRTSLLLASGW